MAGPRGLLVLVAAGLALGLADCGGSTIDGAKAERQLKDEITSKIGARVDSVSCPRDEPWRKAGHFTCRVKGADGTGIDAAVDVIDDKGNVHVHVRGLLRNRDIEARVAARLAPRAGSRVTVHCPDVVLVVPGHEIRCQATRAGSSDRATIVLSVDASGQASFKIGG